MRDEVEVAIVGAGAAGIAAARRLRARGHDVLVIEALERVGGRAHTVTVEGHPLDLGCGWLHSAGRNPMVGHAAALGFAVDRTPSAWGQQLRNLGFPLADQRAAGDAYAGLEARLHGARASDCVGDLIGLDDRWRPYLDALSGYLNGAPLDRLSAADFLAYDDHATDDNWRLPQGYGALIAAAAAGVPIAMGTAVRAIDEAGARVAIETERGTVRADAVIVTVSSAVLAAGAIRFGPAVDDHLHAAAGLPLGLADKLFLALDDAAAVPAESHLLGDPHRAATGSYYLRPLGRPVVECFFGGLGAAALEDGGAAAMEAFAREELGRLLGADFVRGLRPLAATAWGREATIRGSYSHALPGRASARAILATPPSERLLFAGEATSAHDFSTAHGAWASGEAAADRLQPVLSRPRGAPCASLPDRF